MRHKKFNYNQMQHVNVEQILVLKFVLNFWDNWANLNMNC